MRSIRVPRSRWRGPLSRPAFDQLPARRAAGRRRRAHAAAAAVVVCHLISVHLARVLCRLDRSLRHPKERLRFPSGSLARTRHPNAFDAQRTRRRGRCDSHPPRAAAAARSGGAAPNTRVEFRGGARRIRPRRRRGGGERLLEDMRGIDGRRLTVDIAAVPDPYRHGVDVEGSMKDALRDGRSSCTRLETSDASTSRRSTSNADAILLKIASPKSLALFVRADDPARWAAAARGGGGRHDARRRAQKTATTAREEAESRSRAPTRSRARRRDADSPRDGRMDARTRRPSLVTAILRRRRAGSDRFLIRRTALRHPRARTPPPP